MSLKLLIADDHEVVRAGIKQMVAETDIQIIAEAATGDVAWKLTLDHQPDVVLLDVRMPGGDGLACLSRIKLDRPDVPVLMFSEHENPTYVARALALGAAGYLAKSSTRDDLVDAVHRAARGENVWKGDEMRRVSNSLAISRTAAESEIPLTQRECEVLRQLALGLSNKEIAQALSISYETVKEHVQHILRKLGVADRTQAAVWAVRNRLA